LDIIQGRTRDKTIPMKNKEELKKYIQHIHPMPDDIADRLSEDFNYFSFPKNELILKENKINRQTYFLQIGFVRSFTFDKDGQEVTTNIYSAPCFVNEFLSFFKQEPAKQSFQALTECYGWTMRIDDVEKHFHQSNEFREFGRLLVLHHYDMLHERMLQMIKDSAENRYLKLLSGNPDIFQHVPLKIIASYLGITDTSLSRIRKEILQK
jgi:CRP-like cAMP-binding protein